MRSLPRRIQAVQAPVIPIVATLIRDNPGTISLGQGVVSWGPPPQARARLEDFWKDPNNHKYRSVEGISELRQAFAQKMARENRMTGLEPQRIVVTAGANMAFQSAMLAILDPGDEVVLLSPYYFNYEMAVTLASGIAVPVPTDENHQPNLEEIKRALNPRTRALVTISPNNPTGAVYPERILKEINDLCAERGIYHIHDEAYEYFVHGPTPHFSPGSIPGSEKHTLTLFSLSKAYGFAGWRIGGLIAPLALLDPLRKVQDTLLISPTVIAQHAALGCLAAGAAYPLSHMAELRKSRTLMAEALRNLGDLVESPPADGAFYFFCKVRTKLPSMALVEKLVTNFKIAAIPGESFGAHEGCWIRISYGALDSSTAAEGMERLTKGLRALC